MKHVLHETRTAVDGASTRVDAGLTGRARRSTTSLLLTNGAWNATSTVVSGVLAFLLVPLLLNRLGELTYGVWILIGSMFAYSTILQFGLSSAINRHVPVALAKGNDDDIRRVVSTATVFFAGVGLVVALATVVLRWNLPRWFHVPASLVPAAADGVVVVGFLLSVTVVAQTFGAVLTGYQRYDLSAISRIVMVLLRGSVLWFVLARGAGLLAVAWIYGLTELGVNLLQYTFGVRLMPPRVVAVAAFDRTLLREMVAYGGNTFLYSAGAVLAYKASEVIIGVLRSPEEVARYSVAAAGVLTLSAVIESLSAAIKPAVSDLDARDLGHTIRELSLVSQKFALLVILPSTTFLVLMGGDFLRLWTGLARPDVAQAMALIAVGQAFRLTQQSNFLVLVGKGEHRFFGLSVLMVGAATVVTTLLAVGVFHLGLVGAAGAGCLSWVVVSGIVIPAHVNARLGIPRAERRRRVLLPAIAGCMPALLLTGVWKWQHAPRSWPEVILVVVVVAGVTALGAWRFTLEPKERDRLRALAMKMRR